MPGSKQRTRTGNATERRLHYSKEEEDFLTSLVLSHRPDWDAVTRLYNENAPTDKVRNRNALQCKFRKMQAAQQSEIAGLADPADSKCEKQNQIGLGLAELVPWMVTDTPSWAMPETPIQTEAVFFQRARPPQINAGDMGGVPLQPGGERYADQGTKWNQVQNEPVTMYNSPAYRHPTISMPIPQHSVSWPSMLNPLGQKDEQERQMIRY